MHAGVVVQAQSAGVRLRSSGDASSLFLHPKDQHSEATLHLDLRVQVSPRYRSVNGR